MSQEIIQSFLQKMVNQDNRSTAFPFYYVIRTEVEDPAPLNNCDESRWYLIDQSYDSLEELEAELRNGHDYSEQEIKKLLEEAVEYGIKKRWERRGMFLTETDAERHLKLNYYHYSPNAHTYVEHAWRAPELTEFLKALIEHFGIKPTQPEKPE